MDLLGKWVRPEKYTMLELLELTLERDHCGAQL